MIRVLIAKPGLDGHELGARLVAHGLRDAGFEVIYTGPRQTADMIVNTAIQEGVDVIGLSILSGVHKEYCQKILDLLKEKGINEIRLIVGGIIPQKDIPDLLKMGVEAVFGPNSGIQEIAQCFLKQSRI